MHEMISTINDYFSAKKIRKTMLIVVLILLALALRLFFFNITNEDLSVVFARWYTTLLKIGRIDAFKDIFYGYTPPNVYLIDIMTLFRFIPTDQAIKIIPLVFDFFGAWGLWKILRLKFPEGPMPWVGFFSLLFLPTVFVDSAVWGQFDGIYTSFLIWSFFFILREKKLLAIIAFSIGLTFKLQALLLGPIFLVLMFRRKFPFYLWLAVPAVYFISVVPAWLSGGPLLKLLAVYFRQFETYRDVSKRAPNFYAYLKANFLDGYYQPIVLIGLAITAIIICGYLFLRWKRWKDMSALSLCYDAAFFTLVIPFLLPKMHDRYFYAAGIFLLILFFHTGKTLLLPLLSQISSLLAFIPYFTGWSDVFVMIAVPFTLAAVAGLLYYINQHHKSMAQPAAGNAVAVG
jgi:Gpi18-like mannosyltransferase